MIVKRLVTGYALMVGAPILILLVTLSLGSDRAAPSAIDGVWAMSPASTEASAPCREALAAFDGASLVVSQSGRHLSARWKQGPASRLRGTIDQNSFTLCSPGPAGAERSSEALHLDGRIVDQRGLRRLEVRLTPPSGSACDQLALISEGREINLPSRIPGAYNY